MKEKNEIKISEGRVTHGCFGGDIDNIAADAVHAAVGRGSEQVEGQVRDNAESVHFFVEGEPKAQPRPRAFAFHGQARIYNPDTANAWKAAVRARATALLLKKPITLAVHVTLAFQFLRPKSHWGTGKNAKVLKANAPTLHVSKPDTDNLAKAVLDALTNARIWNDDCQVSTLHISKSWSHAQQGCSISIWPDEG